MTELLLTNTNNSWLAKKGLKHLLCEAPEVWLLLLLKYDCVKCQTKDLQCMGMEEVFFGFGYYYGMII